MFAAKTEHMDRIRIGVVGVGHLGNYHLQKYHKFPDVEIIGVSDLTRERTEKAALQYGCSAFNNHRDLIGCVDAVSIAVPTAAHYEVAKDFLAALGIDPSRLTTVSYGEEKPRVPNTDEGNRSLNRRDDFVAVP